MAFEGRVQGRVSADGSAYELVQYGSVRQSVPIAEAHMNEKLKQAIQKNKWEALP